MLFLLLFRSGDDPKDKYSFNNISVHIDYEYYKIIVTVHLQYVKM